MGDKMELLVVPGRLPAPAARVMYQGSLSA